MFGLDYFIDLFGEMTVSHLIGLIIPIIFLVLVYKKFKDYLVKKHEAEEAQKKDVAEALAATRKYPEYRQQSIAIQQQFTTAINEMKAVLDEHTARLTKMTEDSERRERNKLRDRLLQNYRYYTSKETNPLQAWTRMESEAFWELFSDYEDAGGNGYVHSEVQPAMMRLTIIEVNDTDRIAELMQKRK